MRSMPFFWLLCVCLALLWITVHGVAGHVRILLIPSCVCVPRSFLLATFGDHDCSRLRRDPIFCPESEMCC